MSYLYVPHAKEMIGWDEAKRRQTFTIREIMQAAELVLQPAQSMLRRWRDEGAIKLVGKVHHGHHQYQVVAAFTREEVERGRTVEENIWAAMRMLRHFTATDISAHATTDKLPVAVPVARSYIRALLTAGYVRESKKSDRASETRYIMIKATGPRPPMIRRIRVVEDLNTGEIIPLAGVVE